MRLFPIGNIGKLCLCGSQVVMVELALLEDLACSQSDLCPFREIAVKFHPPGQVLSEIQDRIPLWRADQFFHRKNIFLPDRQSIPVAKPSAMFRSLQKDSCLCAHAFSPGIILLAVIDIIESDRRRTGLPGIVSAHNAFPFLLFVHIQLRDGIETVAIKVCVSTVESQSSFEPALSQKDADLIFSLKK